MALKFTARVRDHAFGFESDTSVGLPCVNLY